MAVAALTSDYGLREAVATGDRPTVASALANLATRLRIRADLTLALDLNGQADRAGREHGDRRDRTLIAASRRLEAADARGRAIPGGASRCLPGLHCAGAGPGRDRPHRARLHCGYERLRRICASRSAWMWRSWPALVARGGLWPSTLAGAARRRPGFVGTAGRARLPSSDIGGGTVSRDDHASGDAWPAAGSRAARRRCSEVMAPYRQLALILGPHHRRDARGRRHCRHLPGRRRGAPGAATRRRARRASRRVTTRSA